MCCSAEAQAAVRVSPQPWLTEGDSVTLICEVTVSSTGWTFSWFRDDDHLSDSSRGAGGSYTLSPAARQHTGVYTCRAERGRPAYYTKTSNTQPLWITGESGRLYLYLNSSVFVFYYSLWGTKPSETNAHLKNLLSLLSNSQSKPDQKHYQIHTHNICIRPFLFTVFFSR